MAVRNFMQPHALLHVAVCSLAVSFRLTRKRLLLDLVARCEGVLSGGVEAVEVSSTGDVQATPTAAPQSEYRHVTHRVRTGALAVLGAVQGCTILTAMDAGARRTDDEMKVIVQRFNDWVAAANPQVNAIEARWVGQGMRVGVHTTADVKDGEVYLSAPVSIIMSRDSARKYVGGGHRQFAQLTWRGLQEPTLARVVQTPRCQVPSWRCLP